MVENQHASRRWLAHPVVDFPPSSLHSSAYAVSVIGASGEETLPVLSAVTSDSDDQLDGPYYVDLGSRQVTMVRLVEAGQLLMQWQQGDLLDR